MILHILAFTPRGTLLARELADGLTQKGHSCKAASFRPFADEKGRPVLPAMERETLSGWTQAAFREAGGIIFVSACAIAVRAVAPFLQSKHTDPAVVAVDEAGAFAVSLLSGHTGGANRLAEEIAALTGGTPVVTTATDRAGLLALDDWAARNGWRLECPERVKELSAALLAGKAVSFQSDFPIRDPLPKGYLPGEVQPQVWFTWKGGEKGTALKVLPPALWVGIGCRKGASKEQISAAVFAALEAGGLSPLAVAGAATITLKEQEPGLLAFCREQGWPLKALPPETLAALPGEFTASPFVQEVTGVDNVCERAAVAAADSNPRLLVEKTARNGATAAVAAGEVVLRLTEQKGVGASEEEALRPPLWEEIAAALRAKKEGQNG